MGLGGQWRQAADRPTDVEEGTQFAEMAGGDASRPHARKACPPIPTPIARGYRAGRYAVGADRHGCQLYPKTGARLSVNWVRPVPSKSMTQRSPRFTGPPGHGRKEQTCSVRRPHRGDLIALAG